ncbi:MAG: hypothetical protein ACPGD8_08785, partial [Flavobacteriales bacterium]
MREHLHNICKLGLGLLFILLFTSSLQAQTKIGNDIDGEAAYDYSGTDIAISGDGTIVAIGANSNDGTATNAGHVRVYKNTSGTWTQLGSDIDGEAIGDKSGQNALSDDGTILAVGAPFNDGNGTESGHVRVYEWSGTAWVQKGSDIDGEAAGDRSGRSVSLSKDGTTLSIGAPKNDGAATDAGHVRVYEWSGSAWVQKGSDIEGAAANNSFGFSTSISDNGTILAVGAHLNNNSTGQVRVFEWSGSAWLQKGSSINGEALGDESGKSLSLSSDGLTLAIAGVENDGNGTDAGHVRVYEWSGTAWTQKG